MRRVLLLIHFILASSECQGDCEEAALLQANAEGNGEGRPFRRHYGPTYDLPTLSQSDIAIITKNCTDAVPLVPTGLRKTGGNAVMQIVIMPRANPSNFVGLWDVGADPDDSALLASRDIARGKAFTALSLSSNGNALSSRGVGVLQAGGLPGIEDTNRQANAGIVLFGGGLPLYKDGKLVGAVGVSGDGVVQDESVALGCASEFPTPDAIQVLPDNFTDSAASNPLSPWASARGESLYPFQIVRISKPLRPSEITIWSCMFYVFRSKVIMSQSCPTISKTQMNWRC